MILEAEIIPKEVRVYVPRVYFHGVLTAFTFHYDCETRAVSGASGKDAWIGQSFLEKEFGKNQAAELLEQCVIVAESALRCASLRTRRKSNWKPRKS